jgi:hypothetical protein
MLRISKVLRIPIQLQLKMIEKINKHYLELMERLKMKFHIHNYKPIHWYLEQPATYRGFDVYCDFKILKCRCGKQKKNYINIYTAQLMRIGIGSGLSVLSLENKVSII